MKSLQIHNDINFHSDRSKKILACHIIAQNYVMNINCKMTVKGKM